MIFRNLLFIFIFIISLSAKGAEGADNRRLPASISEDDCMNAILKIIQSPTKKTTQEKKLRYSVDYKNQKDKHIQYGFEVEYTMEEAAVIFNNFMPDKTIFKKSKEEWLSMSYFDQLIFFNRNYEKIYANGSRKPGKMVKITQGLMAKYISDDLICDSGNFELVYKPFDSMEALFETIKKSKKLLGAGSMQVMISNPFDKHLYKSNKSLLKKKLETELGYYNFVNELDTLEKLMNGYAKYKANPWTSAVSSFAHPWLGPMTKNKNIRLKKFLELTYTNSPDINKEMKEYAFQVTSNKFVGGLAFRPDIAFHHSRVASEIRDCHRSVNCIENRVKRETHFLMKGKNEFRKFANLEAFDSVVVPYNMPAGLVNVLKNLFPPHNGLEMVELEMHRNFTYPLRSWKSHLTAIGRLDLLNQVEFAQKRYLETLIEIKLGLRTKTITSHKAKIKMMGALAEFANESKLYEAFKSYYNQILKPNDLKEFQDITLSWSERVTFDKIA